MSNNILLNILDKTEEESSIYLNNLKYHYEQSESLSKKRLDLKLKNSDNLLKLTGFIISIIGILGIGNIFNIFFVSLILLFLGIVIFIFSFSFYNRFDNIFHKNRELMFNEIDTLQNLIFWKKCLKNKNLLKEEKDYIQENISKENKEFEKIWRQRLYLEKKYENMIKKLQI